MYYELYIDVFIVVNIWINFIVMMFTKKILNLSGGIFRMLLASAAGALFLCIYILTALRFIKFSYFLFLFFTGCVMIIIAFKVNSVLLFVRAAIIFFVSALCLNGIFNQIIGYIGNFYQIIFSSIIIYFIFLLAQRVLKIYRNDKKMICTIKLFLNGKEILANGLWDTGNCLISPYHSKGVSIVEYHLCEPYIDNAMKNIINLYMGNCNNEENTKNEMITGMASVFAVPYKTINSSNGILPVIAAEKMIVKKEGEIYEYDRPLIGFTNNFLSQNGEYTIILTTNS